MSTVLSSVVLLLLASSETSAASYGAPTVWEAHDAFNAKVEELVLSSRDGVSLSTDVTQMDIWALNFDVVSCNWGRERTINPRAEGIPSNQGYLCMIKVLPNQGDSFVTRGLFTHDGMRWRYFGWLEPSDGFYKNILVTHKLSKSQPYVDSPYLNTSSVQYRLGGDHIVDNTPWRGPTEGFYHEDVENLESQGANDLLINSYERLNTPYGHDWDDLLEYPKGTVYRNQRGY
ncbi:MAG: hypothetical protein V3V30_09685 [Parvularculaceae bacterium]